MENHVSVGETTNIVSLTLFLHSRYSSGIWQTRLGVSSKLLWHRPRPILSSSCLEAERGLLYSDLIQEPLWFRLGQLFAFQTTRRQLTEWQRYPQKKARKYAAEKGNSKHHLTVQLWPRSETRCWEWVSLQMPGTNLPSGFPRPDYHWHCEINSAREEREFPGFCKKVFFTNLVWRPLRVPCLRITSTGILHKRASVLTPEQGALRSIPTRPAVYKSVAEDGLPTKLVRWFNRDVTCCSSGCVTFCGGGRGSPSPALFRGSKQISVPDPRLACVNTLGKILSRPGNTTLDILPQLAGELITAVRSAEVSK